MCIDLVFKILVWGSNILISSCEVKKKIRIFGEVVGKIWNMEKYLRYIPRWRYYQYNSGVEADLDK